MKLNTNSNTYTIIYATVIVVIVAFLLAVVSSALRPRQDANVALDKKKQILSSLHMDLSGDVDALYAKVIREEQWGDENNTLPYYTAQTDKGLKYVIPMTGTGLWGGIWGYLALDADKNTIYGVYFNHSSETPGLGGEIVTEKFQSQFVGKHILGAKGLGIAIMKTGKTTEEYDQVDAISGATITSKGVEDMIINTLAKYESLHFFSARGIEVFDNQDIEIITLDNEEVEQPKTEEE